MSDELYSVSQTEYIVELRKERDALRTECKQLRVQRDQVIHLLLGGTITTQQAIESGLGVGVLIDLKRHKEKLNQEKGQT